MVRVGVGADGPSKRLCSHANEVHYVKSNNVPLSAVTIYVCILEAVAMNTLVADLDACWGWNGKGKGGDGIWDWEKMRTADLLKCVLCVKGDIVSASRLSLAFSL